MHSMDQIYQEYAKTVYRYLLSLAHDSDLAEELTQETFFQAIRSSSNYDGDCRLSTWLCGIAKNVLLTYRRKNPPVESLDDTGISGFETGDGAIPRTDEQLTSPSAESDALRTEDRVSLFRSLHLLEDPFKEVLYLRIFGNLSFRDIGNILGKTENWARVTFYRGKEKLRKEISTENADK